jgi:glycosyltransferase involved in cell wall biosynthesis
LRVALIALSVRGAMGHYLDALITPLTEQAEVHLFVPEHYSEKTGKATVHLFSTGSNKRDAILRLLNPFLGLPLWQRIEKIKPDVVHLFNGEGYPWTLLWVYWANHKKLPMVVTVHDPEPHPGNLQHLINSYLGRFTLVRASRVHIHSKSFFEAVTQQGVLPERLCVIPHGSIASRFVSHRQAEVLREPLVLFFGRLEAYKGLDLLIEASLQLKGEFRVVIAGPGQLPHTLVQIIQDNSDVFELHNRYLVEAEVASLFQRSAICVLPYRQATQSSLPLIAAAFGVPVVATEVGGFVEDVPLVNGLLVPPGNPEALAKGIREAIGRIPYYPKEYEFEFLAKKFVNLYDDACHNNLD